MAITSAIPGVIYFGKTLYLFTASDFYTFVIPTMLFGIFGGLSGPLLTSNATPTLLSIWTRVPHACFVVWTNTLLFNISNQQSPSAVEEDRINKPHRPIPSGRITARSARMLCLILLPLVVILGWFYNVFYETLVLLAMQFVYNDLRWCDGHWLIRNALISIGYGLYSAISILIIIGPGNTLNTKGIQWIFIIVLVMLSTQHICDIKDVAGDRLKGRQTVPIIFGDHYCRKSIELSVYACSIICLAFFDSAFWSSAMTMSMARMIAYRLMNFRSLGDDKLTWKLWALWTVNLFVLPLTRSW